MELNIICENFVLMDLINPFGVSGDVTGYINMQISTYLYFWKHTIGVHGCHYSNCSQGLKQSFGRKEGYSKSMFENCLRTSNIEWGGLLCPQLNNFQIRLPANNVPPTY